MMIRLHQQLISRTASRCFVVGRCRLSPTILQRRFLGDGLSGDEPSEGTSGIDHSNFTHEVKIYMPDMGEGGGKILKWYKQKGDIVRQDDILCDIETPDFSFGMVTDDECDAIMGEVMIEANSEPVEANQVICTVFHPADNDDSSKTT